MVPNDLSIVDEGSSGCEGVMDRLPSVDFIAEKFRRARALVQARCLLLCSSLGDGQ
jgi:hypothetical protein